MFPVFPLFNVKCHKLKNITYIYAAGGGGNPLYGKKNGIVIFSEDLKELAYYETEGIVYEFLIFKNEILLILEGNSYERLIFNWKKNLLHQKEILFFEGDIRRFNGNIFYLNSGEYYMYKNRKIRTKSKRFLNASIVTYDNMIIDLPIANGKYIEMDDDMLVYDKSSIFLLSNMIKIKFKQVLSVTYNRKDSIFTVVGINNNIYIYAVREVQLEYVRSFRHDFPIITSALYENGRIYIASLQGNTYWVPISILRCKYFNMMCSSVFKLFSNEYIFLFLYEYLFNKLN